MTDIATRAAAFISKWDAVTLNERAVAQTHFNELCHMLGVPAPLDAGQQSEVYRFEKPLTKLGGGAGFADVWKHDHFAWEYKTKGRYPDLRAAYTQLVLYKGDLGNPPVLVACDIENYYVSIEFTGYRTRVEQFKHADLQNAATRDLLRLVLTNPEQLRPVERAETITEKAAKQLGDVARLLEDRGFAPLEIAPFLMKLLFALFAEDTQLLPAELMSRSIRDAIFDPDEFVPMTHSLFQTMNAGGYFGSGNKVPRFNGWLFAKVDVLPLNANELQFLNEVAKLDWSCVEPAIFGTLFERSLDPAKRTQLGAHYTSRKDILLIVEPVLMQPYRQAWAEVKAGVDALYAQWQTATGAARQRLRSIAEGMVFAFMEQLAQVRVLDPACGSGNFLYVALHQLKDLEQEVWRYAGGLELTQPELGVTPAQFYGIEKNPFAAELAQVVVWIGYLQWLKQNGWLEGRPKEPVLQSLHTIECRDAILELDAEGKPLEPPWPPVEVILGNPPFLGSKKLRGELGDCYVADLQRLYSKRVTPSMDLVTYWFERARTQLEQGLVGRVGLLATNTIRQQRNRAVLTQIKQTGDLFMAWSDRAWVLDGAAVRVAMVGFDRGLEQAKTLDGVPVEQINADLTAGQSIANVHRLAENLHLAYLGKIKIGPFNLTAEQAMAMLQQANPSGRANHEVVRPLAGGDEITGRPKDEWIIDFGPTMPESEAALYEAPYAYVQQHVKPVRATNHRASYQRLWWLHGEPRPALCQALQGKQRYIVTALVAKHRLFAWLPAEVSPAARLVVIAREDDYFFGVLHSRVHELWALRMGARHGAGNDPTYNISTCFETFPFPWSPGSEPSEQASPVVQALAEASRELVRRREAWLNPPADTISAAELPQRTLTNLYNQRPDWLDLAHQRLDAAVLAAYGWEHPLSDTELLARLLALNAARTG